VGRAARASASTLRAINHIHLPLRHLASRPADLSPSWVHRSEYKWKRGKFYDAVKILEERGQGASKQFLVAWSGKDAAGDAWPPDWRPARDVSEALKEEWRSKLKLSTQRLQAAASASAAPFAQPSTSKGASMTQPPSLPAALRRPRVCEPSGGASVRSCSRGPRTHA
jgi:hypothetical protein